MSLRLVAQPGGRRQEFIPEAMGNCLWSTSRRPTKDAISIFSKAPRLSLNLRFTELRRRNPPASHPDGQHQNARQAQASYQVQQSSPERMGSMDEIAHHQRTYEAAEISERIN